MKKETWKTIIQVLVSILTAALTAIQKVLRHVNVEEQAVHLICERRRAFINSRVERGIIKAKFHRGLLKRVDFIESMQRWEL